MFFTIKSVLFALVAASIVGHAAPVFEQKRQIGNLQCNLDRAGIVASLFAIKGTIKDLDTATASDPGNNALIAEAQIGLNTANGGIKTIAQSILTGQQAPSSARTVVEQGLTLMFDSLGNVTSTDPKVQSSLATAKSQLQDASTAGNGVLANCN